MTVQNCWTSEEESSVFRSSSLEEHTCLQCWSRQAAYAGRQVDLMVAWVSCDRRRLESHLRSEFWKRRIPWKEREQRHRGANSEWRGKVEVLNGICGCDAPSSALPSLRGLLVSVSQLEGSYLDPVIASVSENFVVRTSFRHTKSCRGVGRSSGFFRRHF